LANSPISTEPFGYGVDRLVRGQAALPPAGLRFGLLTNDAARTADDPGALSRQALQRAGVRLTRLFSPEHGVSAAAADGVPVPDGFDPITQLPVVSLYSDRTRPTPAMLGDLDGVLIDLPDVGARFYTFIWTMSQMLEVCGEVGLPVWVLDRPNPIGGDLAAAEGPMLDATCCASFLGRYPMPIRHSLTIGELAGLWNEEQGLRAKLHVVPAVGWNRADHHPATGVPFTPTSPSMPRYASAMFYPGVCLFEATNVSVGRGTEHPFEQIGAPWLDADRLHAAFAALGLTGVESEPVAFTPSIHPHRGERCRGIRLRLVDPQRLRPVAMGLLLLAEAIKQSRGALQWSRYPTAANPQGDRHLERLVGCGGVAELLERGDPNLPASVQALTAATGWCERVRPHLLYPDVDDAL